jgi:hypothetical protein
MFKKLLKVLLILCLILACLSPVFVLWMRMGEEDPLDYSPLAFEPGPEDAAINGYTYLREFCQDNTAEIPEDYPYKFAENFEDDIDYNLYYNWDLEFFEKILSDNKDFMAGVERAFDLPQFKDDQEPSPETLIPHIGQLRSYTSLRLLEARVLFMSGEEGKALARLSDLAAELEVFSQSGGGLIGLLSAIAMNGMLTYELWVYQAHGDFIAVELKDFANSYDIRDSFTSAVELAMSQEFQFVTNVIDEISENGANAYISYTAEPPSKLSILWQRVVLFVGLRKIQTLNQVFQAYSEISEQSRFPVVDRNYTYADEIESRLSQSNWGSLMNRNPYGRVLLAILYPAVRAVLEKVEMAKVSSSATQLSYYLHAYYLEQAELPNSLEVLIPDYIDKIPIDPFDGKPMRYSKERKIVYSVGKDFTDQGGSDLPFTFQIDDAADDSAAEHDVTEPTYPLRFVM